MIDKRAKRILFDYFWKDGWREEGSSKPEAADIEYARSKGFWFDPVTVTHDQLVQDLKGLTGSLSAKTVGDAFLASLTSRRLDLRSALGSFAFAYSLPRHDISNSPCSVAKSGAVRCHICGHYTAPKPEPEDLNVLNFERHKWGGVRHGRLLYAWFDLSRFNSLGRIAPTEEDRAIMQNILEAAANLPDKARPIELAKSLSGLFKSNNAERRVLIEILSICGVLQPRNESGYFGEFTFEVDQRQPDEHKNDWNYPAVWWRGSDGVNATAVAHYFPEL